MKLLLQKFGFKDSSYERPNRYWICGLAKDGHGCKSGPLPDGRCRGRYECEPQKKAGQWKCSRSKEDGGPCEKGPNEDGVCACARPSCKPTRSLQAKRGILAISLLLICTIIATVTFGRTFFAPFLSPGPLSHAHAPIEDCGICHANFESGASGWWNAALNHSDEIQKSNIPACRSCHQVNGNPADPHGLSPKKLAQISTRIEADNGENRPLKRPFTLFSIPSNSGKPIPCSACHREHRGDEPLLSHMMEDVCNTCHLIEISSFENGHPGFRNYPYRSNSATNIKFTHTIHLKRYFAKRQDLAPAGCSACHEQSVGGRFMTLINYDTSCKGCHEDEIKGTGGVASEPVLPVLSVPGFDLAYFKDLGINVGRWPDFADGEFNPFMREAMSYIPGVAEAFDTLKDLDLMYLDQPSDDEIKAIETLAWGYKRLIADLVNQGLKAFEHNSDSTTTLAPGLSLDLVKAAQQKWFPNLFEELNRHDTGEVIASEAFVIAEASKNAPSSAVEPVSPEDWMKHGGWRLGEFALLYRPSGHKDELLKVWLDLTMDMETGEAQDRLLDWLYREESPGRCEKCHSQTPTGSAINWKAHDANQRSAQLPKFSHLPHLTLLGKEKCETCHKPQDQAAEETTSSTKPDHDFKGMEISTCKGCHSESKARIECSSCHRYHMEDAAEPSSETNKPATTAFNFSG